MPFRGRVLKKAVRRPYVKRVIRIRRRRPFRTGREDKVGEFQVLDEVGDVDPITGEDVPTSNKASEDKKVEKTKDKEVNKKGQTDKKDQVEKKEETNDGTKTDKEIVIKKETTEKEEKKGVKPVKKRTKGEELIYDVLRFTEALERSRDYKVYIKRERKDGLICPIEDVKETASSDLLFLQCVLYSGVKKSSGELCFCFKRDPDMSESMKNLENYTSRIRTVLKAFQELVNNSGKPLYNPTTSEGFWRAVVARSNHCGDVMLQVEVNAASKAESEETYKEVKELLTEFFTNGPGKDCHVTSLYVKIVFNKLLSVSHCAMGQQYLEEQVLDLKLKIYPRTYYWICMDAATVIGKQLKAIFDQGSYTEVLEIGCGTGVFGQFLAKSCKHVYGVDSAVATKEAEDNAKYNNLQNCTYSGGTYKAALLNVIPKLLGNHNVFTIVNDPGQNLLSRALMETLRTVKSIKKLAYFTQFSKKCLMNLFALCQVSGIGNPYFPEKIIPVDLGLDRYRAIVVLKHCGFKMPQEFKTIPSPVKLPAVKKEAVTVTKPTAAKKPVTLKPLSTKPIIKRDREGRLIHQRIGGSGALTARQRLSREAQQLRAKQRAQQLRDKQQLQKNEVLRAHQRVSRPERNKVAYDPYGRRITRDRFGRKIVSGRDDKLTVTRDRLGRRIVRGRDDVLGQKLQRIPTNRLQREDLLRERKNAIADRNRVNVGMTPNHSRRLGKQNNYQNFMHNTIQHERVINNRNRGEQRLRRGLGMDFERERQVPYADDFGRMRDTSYQQRFPPDATGTYGFERNIWMTEDGRITVEGRGSPGTNIRHESRRESWYNAQEHDLRERLHKTGLHDVANYSHRIEDNVRGIKSQDFPDLRGYLQSNRSNTDSYNYNERDLRILLAEHRSNLQSDFDLPRREIPIHREIREPSPRSRGMMGPSPQSRDMGEPSPRNRGMREVSPRNRGMREPSPRNRGMREPSPQNRGMREPSPRNRGIRERSPRNRGMRELSPRNRRMREPSPRSRGMREPSPQNRGMRESSPRSRGIREPSPRSRGMREPSPKSRPRSRGVREPSPRSRGMRESSPRTRGMREPSPRGKEMRGLSPRRDRHMPPSDLAQSGAFNDKYRRESDYMPQSKIREPESLQKSFDSQREEKRSREIAVKEREYRSPERESRISSGMPVSDRYRERESVLHEPNEKVSREYQRVKNESDYRDNFDKTAVTASRERERTSDNWNRTVNLLRKGYSRSPEKDSRRKYDTDYKEKGETFRSPRDDPRKDVRQDYYSDVRSKEIYRDVANREQRHLESRRIDDIRKDDGRRERDDIRRDRDDGKRDNRDDGRRDVDHIRRERDDDRKDRDDIRRDRDESRRDRVESRRDRDDNRKVSDRRGRESIEDTLVETLKQVVPSKGINSDAAYKLKEVLVSAIHKVGLESDAPVRRSSVAQHAERSRYESDRLSRIAPDPPRIAPDPPRITLDMAQRIVPEPPRITDHLPPRNAYPQESEIIRPYSSRVESVRGLPSFPDDRHYGGGDLRYRSVRSPPKPMAPLSSVHDYGMGSRDLPYNKNVIPIPDSYGGRIPVPPPAPRYFPPPATAEPNKPYPGAPAPNNFYSRTYEPQLNMPPPLYRGIGNNVLRPPGTEMSPWISKMPPM